MVRFSLTRISFLTTTLIYLKATALVTNNNNNPPPTYPLARRSLIERARSLDPSLARGDTLGTYSPTGWSNRLGTVLTPVSLPGVYTADRPFYWNRIDVGCRMTVIQQPKNSGNELFVHSPVRLDPPLVKALSELGHVEHVVSPNYEHVKFAREWGETYDDAMMWGCPGLMERETEVRWTGELEFGCRPPGFDGERRTSDFVGVFGEDVEYIHFDCEVNPFTGKPFFNEVVFYHVPSKTLLTTDTYWNYPSADGVTNKEYKDLEGGWDDPAAAVVGGERDFGVWELAPDVGRIPVGSSLWKIGMDKIYRPFYLKLMVKKDREKFREIVRHITEVWEPETLIPAHGDILRGRKLIKTILKSHFDSS